MEKKCKKILNHLINSASDIFSLYNQDSFTDEDSKTATSIENELNIIEGFVSDKMVREVAEFISKTIAEGNRISEIVDMEEEEIETFKAYDVISEQTTRLKTKIDNL